MDATGGYAGARAASESQHAKHKDPAQQRLAKLEQEQGERRVDASDRKRRRHEGRVDRRLLGCRAVCPQKSHRKAASREQIGRNLAVLVAAAWDMVTLQQQHGDDANCDGQPDDRQIHSPAREGHPSWLLREHPSNVQSAEDSGQRG